MRFGTYALSALLLLGCSTGRKSEVTSVSGDKPGWVGDSRITWESGDQVFFRQEYSVRGDERLNGCYQLAKLEAKETLLREIAEDIKGQIDNAQQSLSESAELVLSQVRSSEYGGKVTGMKFLEQYHQRTVAGGVERLDCYILAALKKSDYDHVKRQVLFKVSEADPEIKQAIQNRAVQFFSKQAVSE